MSKKMVSLHELMHLYYSPKRPQKKEWTVEEWLEWEIDINKKQRNRYPNAKKAYEIRTSPLEKALK